MNILPKIRECPNSSCGAINLLRINGITYENELESLKNWILKKKFHCRKCKIEIGLFIDNQNKEEKIVWLDIIKCEEPYVKKLNKLQKNKDKYKEKGKEKECLKVIEDIQSIQNKIKLDQVKVKVKLKIQNINLSV
jgi:hypothetical protein